LKRKNQLATKVVRNGKSLPVDADICAAMILATRLRTGGSQPLPRTAALFYDFQARRAARKAKCGSEMHRAEVKAGSLAQVITDLCFKVYKEIIIPISISSVSAILQIVRDVDLIADFVKNQLIRRPPRRVQ
jgi:hypothetical protein